MRRARAAAAILGVGAVVFGVAGCGFGSSDTVRIRNDTSFAVRVRLCNDDHCKHGFDPVNFVLHAGESHPVGVSTGPNVYLVETLSRRRLGCLPLVMLKPVEGVVALVSQHRSCSAPVDWTQWPPLGETK